MDNNNNPSWCRYDGISKTILYEYIAWLKLITTSDIFALGDDYVDPYYERYNCAPSPPIMYKHLMTEE